MPFPVACRCGQRFMAEDFLAGKQVKCPKCGGGMNVPAKPTAAAPQKPATAAADPQVKVRCKCGRAYGAQAAMRGKSLRCPACGGSVYVPQVDDDEVDLLSLGLLTADPLAAPVMPANSALVGRRTGGDTSQQNLLIALGGGAALVVVIVIVVIAVASSRLSRSPVADASSAIVPPAAPASSAADASPAAPVMPPGPPAADVAPAASPFSEVPASKLADPVNAPPKIPTITKSFAGLTGGGEFAPGLQQWHAAGKEPFKGVHQVGPGDNLQAHYSWLVQLLPYLGHEKIYEKFNFQQPLTGEANIQVGGQIIPEFLNPADPRQRWEGFPFDDMALTHFVGMAGIEDRRNVVAARLPRSDPRAGVFGYDTIARPAEITDGLSQTMLVVGGGEIASPWVMGGGATVRGAREPYFDKLSGFGSRGRKGDGALVVMADGSVRQVSASVDPKVFRAMCTIHGNEQVDLAPHAPPATIEQE